MVSFLRNPLSSGRPLSRPLYTVTSVGTSGTFTIHSHGCLRETGRDAKLRYRRGQKAIGSAFLPPYLALRHRLFHVLDLPLIGSVSNGFASYPTICPRPNFAKPASSQSQNQGSTQAKRCL